MSVPGEGSTFFFDLPVTIPAHEEVEKQPEAAALQEMPEHLQATSDAHVSDLDVNDLKFLLVNCDVSMCTGEIFLSKYHTKVSKMSNTSFFSVADVLRCSQVDAVVVSISNFASLQISFGISNVDLQPEWQICSNKDQEGPLELLRTLSQEAAKQTQTALHLDSLPILLLGTREMKAARKRIHGCVPRFLLNILKIRNHFETFGIQFLQFSDDSDETDFSQT